MKARIADPKKYVAGLCIVALALGTFVIGYFRASNAAMIGGILFAISGWGFTAQAKKKKEVPPHLPGLRWFHVVLVSTVVVGAVFWLYQAAVR